jgi:hypothetical protein
MNHSTMHATPAKRPYHPAAPRQRPPADNLPPLVRVADVHTNRSRGKFGLLPYSRRQLDALIKKGKVPVVKLGPRTTCLTRATVLDLIAGRLP